MNQICTKYSLSAWHLVGMSAINKIHKTKKIKRHRKLYFMSFEFQLWSLDHEPQHYLITF